jgi:parallel beta-helix repeat protein
MRTINSRRKLKALLITLGSLGWIVLVGFAYQPQILTVCPAGCPLSSIQQAIDIAHNGDIIQILPGTYIESLHISKSITLQGVDASQVILKAPDHKQDVIYAISFPFPIRLNISGVTITEGRAGIYVEGMARVTIRGSRILKNMAGILLLNGFMHARIENNRIEGNGNLVYDTDFRYNRGGIVLRLDGFPQLGMRWLSAQIQENEILNNLPGISVDGANAWIEDNLIQKNGMAGIVVYDSSWAVIQDNEITQNWWTGVQIYYDPKVVMKGNVIAENEDQRK